MPVTIKPAPGTGSDVATTHVSAAPGAVDYVLDEVQANSTAVAVFDGAASATLAANTTRVGAGATAPAQYSTAVGRTAAAGTSVTHLYCTAVGHNATASELNATAIGYLATASGINSTAVRGTASGDTSVSVGAGSTADGISAIAIGGGAAPNNYDIAIGSGADATGGSSSIAIGRDADATAANAIGLGHTASASGEFSIAIGKSSIAGVGGAGASSMAIGAGASSATFTDCVVLASSATGVPISATTATAIGDVIIGSGGAGGLGYLRGNQTAQTYTIVAATNDIVPTSAGNATLAAGVYTPTALAAHAQAQMNAQIAGAGFTVSYNTTTELYTFSRGSAFTMAWGAAGTAFAVFGFPQTTTASATSQVGISQRPDAAELSPAVSAAVELGSPFRAYGKLYVDAIYPRTRLTDYIRLTMTQTSGGGGAWANSTSANHIVFPGLAAPTWSVSSTVAAPGSCFSNGSSSTAFAARYTYTPSTAYSRVLVTVSINNMRGGTGTGNVNMTIGAGATAAGMTTTGPFQYTNASSQYTCAQLTTVLDLSAADRFFGPMWIVESGASVSAGTGTGIEAATIVVIAI